MSPLEQINREIAANLFEQTYPGVAYNPPQSEICVSWGDFRQNRYEQGVFVIATHPVGEPEDREAFNGVETTRCYPAIRNGQACTFIRTSFTPTFGHANYGQASFE